MSAVERRTLEMPPGRALFLTREEAHALLADPGYRSSLGQPGHARHFRRALPDGTGLHLVLRGDTAELHQDLHDPHGGPAALLLHLAADAPREALSLAAAVAAVLRRMAR